MCTWFLFLESIHLHLFLFPSPSHTMATVIPTSNIFLFSFYILLLVVSGKSDKLKGSSLGLGFGLKKEKMSHLRFFFHDIVAGPNPTAVQVAKAAMTDKSPTGFGGVAMIDDPLTEGPSAKSKLVGRAQGLYASASQKDVGLLMAMNFAFMDGKYNGSTLSVLGRNAVFSDVREMPVIGGTGLFRFARGYAQAHTRKFDLKTGDAVVEYNVYVVHY